MSALILEPNVPSDIATRPCPVCGCERIRQLFRQSFAEIPNLCLLKGYDVVVCSHCGFGFADGIPDQAAFNAYYRDLSKYEHQHNDGRESEADLARFRATADCIVPTLPSRNVRILDIGCSTGGLLSILQQRGFTNLLGLDPSPGCAAAAQRLYGIRVLTAPLTEIGRDHGPFDSIILVGVVEHVRDLTPFLATVRDLGAPGCRVYIEVPDASSFHLSRNAPYQEFSVEHINFFSPVSLANLMRCAGFSRFASIQCVRESKPGTMAPVVAATFIPDSAANAAPLKRDEVTMPALQAYIDESEATERNARQAIGELVASQEPIIVWGVGSLTLRLLATTDLPRVNIRAYVDSNPKYQGNNLNGVPILSPRELGQRREPILIASWMYQREIADQIRNTLGLPNPLILPYPV
jgi:SAM-dependent methyltransferase